MPITRETTLAPEQPKLEAETREEINKKLIAAGWVVQDKNRLNLYESLGVAVREMDTDTGPADYMLFIDGVACGIIEAKREGADLGAVDLQSKRYATSTVKYVERAVAESEPLPFLYEATNHEIRFRDERDPYPRSRFVFHFHHPETLKAWLEEGISLRQRFHDLPELDLTNLRDCQIDAIHGIEASLKAAKPRALLRLPTGIFYAQGVKANVIFFDAKPASKTAWTKKLWVYDFRTNVHKTLKQNKLTFQDFAEFIKLYKAEDRSKRRPTRKKPPHPDPLPEGEGKESKAAKANVGRWRAFTYAELIASDKTNLDIFWLKDESLEDTENLPPPDVLAQEIVEQLEAALEEFRSVEAVLAGNGEN